MLLSARTVPLAVVVFNARLVTYQWSESHRTNLLTGINPFPLYPSLYCRRQLVIRHPGEAIFVSGSVWNNKLDVNGTFFSPRNVRFQGVAARVFNCKHLLQF